MAKIEGGKDKRNDSRHNDYESFDDSSKSAERRPKEQLWTIAIHENKNNLLDAVDFTVLLRLDPFMMLPTKYSEKSVKIKNLPVSTERAWQDIIRY